MTEGSMMAKWIDIGNVSYKAWRNPSTGEKGREWSLPGAIVVWICIAMMTIAGFGWAIPALADPGDQSPSTTRPDDRGDEQGQGQGDGSSQGSDQGQGRGNDPSDTNTTTSTSLAGSDISIVTSTTTTTIPIWPGTSIPGLSPSTTVSPTTTQPIECTCEG